VAVLVVDALEMVEVDQHEAGVELLARATRELGVHRLVEPAVVEQSAQRVAGGQAALILVQAGITQCDRHLGGIGLEDRHVSRQEGPSLPTQSDQ